MDGSFFGVEAAHLLYLRYPGMRERFLQEGVEEEGMGYCGQKLFGFDICYEKLK